MPVNRNALIRYNTINNCLTNRHRLWTLEDLIDACSDALYEFEGIDKGVSKRTVQMDIQMMRSEKIGYNAPIIVKDKKYYTYEDPEYSITNIPLTDKDLLKLTEVADILKQFKGFNHFKELTGIVQRLEDKIHTSKTAERPIIDLEKNDHLKGLEHIDTIFKSIAAKTCLSITYQSFKARMAETFKFHPVLLKEYKNRWFVLGKRRPSNPYLLLALDRIDEVSPMDIPLMDLEEEKIKNYFEHVVGVSVNPNELPEEVKLQIDHQNAPYVLTKPLHHSQQLIDRNHQGVVISIFVQINFELEREILGFGDSIKVIAPSRLRSRIKEKHAHAYDLYETDINETKLDRFIGRFEHKGFAVNQHTYSRREVNRMGKLLHEFKKNGAVANSEEVYAIRGLLQKIPDLWPIIYNANLRKILQYINPDLFLVKAIYFNKPPLSNWYVTWHQDITINVSQKMECDGYNGWTQKENVFGVRPPKEVLDQTVSVRIHLDDTTDQNGALSIVPASHRSIHTHDEIKLITGNSLPFVCEMQAGGLHLMKPLILHSSSKSTIKKQRRVIHLEFNSVNLPNGLEWAERQELSVT